MILTFYSVSEICEPGQISKKISGFFILKKEEVARIFELLPDGGQVEMDSSDSAAGEFFAIFRDRYGIEWIVEFKAGS